VDDALADLVSRHELRIHRLDVHAMGGAGHCGSSGVRLCGCDHPLYLPHELRGLSVLGQCSPDHARPRPLG
jgi:hypothetical protein